MEVRLLMGLLATLAATPQSAPPVPESPEAMYRAWCAVCHGADGRGDPTERPVKTPPPDSTSCRLTTPETDADWLRVIARGGVAAGLSSDMPAFESLSFGAQRGLVDYLRGFCRQSGWPNGNLNFPRPLIGAKAFPESEAALRPMLSHGESSLARLRIEASYAIRVGRHWQLEAGLPIESIEWFHGPVTGNGDLRLEAKSVLHTSSDRSFILSGGLETTLPTGSRRWGFGEGTTVFEPFLAAGRFWRSFYVQADVRGLLPLRHYPTEPIRYLEYNVSLLRPIDSTPGAWTFGIELSGLDRGAAVTPQVIKTITKSGALTAGMGVKIPVKATPPYVSELTRWTGYVIWDYMEPIRPRR